MRIFTQYAMAMKRFRKTSTTLFLFLAGAVLLVVLWRWWVSWHYTRWMYSAEGVPARRVAIVFGAQVYSNGSLSPMLRDRVETAVRLYHAGKVQKLLLSGDNRFDDYNEPSAMMAYAIERGVSPEDIQPDYAGRRTYDTCYRARGIFQLNEAVLVTQKFHLARALFTCRALGVEAVGVPADLQRYGVRTMIWLHARETASTLVALLDVVRRHSAPVMGNPIPIN